LISLSIPLKFDEDRLKKVAKDANGLRLLTEPAGGIDSGRGGGTRDAEKDLLEAPSPYLRKKRD